jgi:hypothetical protein
LAQTDTIRAGSDTTALSKQQKKKIYSGPRKASIMSACLPGLGQVYNKKYWKVPVIYAALGGFSYFFYVNNGNYNDYRGALKRSIETGTAEIRGGVFTTQNLQDQKLYYKKYRDISAIAIGLIYLLNIVDANVDAHLKTFDVSDDLSMQVRPWVPVACLRNATGIMGGVSITVKFR